MEIVHSVVLHPGKSHVKLHARFDKFGDGQWADLLDEAFRWTTVNECPQKSVG